MRTTRRTALLPLCGLLLACRTDAGGVGDGFDAATLADGPPASQAGQAGGAPVGGQLGGGGGSPDAAAATSINDGGALPGADARSSGSYPDAAPTADARVTPPEPAERACALVTCSGAGCCTAWYAFSTDPTGKAHRDDADLVSSFAPNKDAVAVAYAFTAEGETGAVGFSFAAPRKVGALRVTMQSSGAAVGQRFVTLEADVGRAGCAYALRADGAANLATPMYCWGGSFTPDGMSIRLQAKSAGAGVMNVTGVRLD